MSIQSTRIQLEIDSRFENVSLVGCAIAAFCRTLQMDDMQCYQIETCAVEAINNAIIHAYKKQAGNTIKIIWIVNSEELSIQVMDKGISMTHIPEPKPLSHDEESGRGWYIMREWMDEVNYVVEKGTNILTLKKKLSFYE